MTQLPMVSVAVVAHNAAGYLPGLLSQLKGQTYPPEHIEVLLIDSVSTDSTLAIMRAFEQDGGMTVRVLHNPGRTLPCGCNVALGAYRGDMIIRIDAHAVVSPDLIATCVTQLQAGEDIVGGCVQNVPPDSPWNAMLHAIDTSRFCGGVAAFRNPGKRRYVDTLAFAMYRRQVYDTVGLYDERLSRTEDNDMAFRIKEAGFKFCYIPEIVYFRYPRSRLRDMVTQKWANGKWIGLTMAIQPRCFSLRHFAPLALVLALVGGSLLAALGWPWPLLALLILYGLGDLAATAYSVATAAMGKGFCLATLWWIFPLVHLAYGWGTLYGLAGARRLSRLPRQKVRPVG